MGITLKKYRVSTTISLNHHALLKKYMGKYETQQKVIEVALESLENSSRRMPIVSREDELWMALKKYKTVCLVQKEGLKLLFETADIDRFNTYVASQKPLGLVVETFYQKPLKECSLKEVLEALVINGQVSNQMDTIDYTDDGDHYTYNVTHDLGINYSRMMQLMYESIFNSYEAIIETSISERSLFIRILKK